MSSSRSNKKGRLERAKTKRLKQSPISMECVLYKIIDLPGISENNYNGIIIGKVMMK